MLPLKLTYQTGWVDLVSDLISDIAVEVNLVQCSSHKYSCCASISTLSAGMVHLDIMMTMMTMMMMMILMVMMKMMMTRTMTMMFQVHPLLTTVLFPTILLSLLR